MTTAHLRILKLVALTLMLVLADWSSVRAEDKRWFGPDGTILPDTDYRKTENGFGGAILVTPDRDWQAKWDTPPEQVPYFYEAESVNVGQSVKILLFIANPKTNAEMHVSVLCDIKVTRPDQSVSVDVPGATCLSGKLEGDPSNVRLSPIVLTFIGEDSDPLGEWVFEVAMTDQFRGTTLRLKRSILLKQG